MQTKLDFLIERVQKQNPQANIKKIRAAYECAAKAHEGQKRRNGEPYIIHPVAVAEIVVEMGLDTDSICAALLHDCIEDTEFGYKEIENKFGTPVAELVDGVTRLGMLRYSKEQEQFEDLRKMFLAMAKDIRVILIKLADRLHNARTFQFLPERKQRDKALETMEIYAPIAHRLGMSRIKWGVLQPLLVQEREDYYEIVAGERRWRAAKIAGIKEIPVIIKKLTRQEIMEISLIENIQREDLNPIEEALAFKRLLTEFNLKQDEVAERVSKSRTAVTNAMRLLKLNEKVQQMVIDEMLTTGHARALLGIEDQEQQYIIAQKIFDEKLSVRDTEKLVKSLQNEKKKKKEEKEKIDPKLEAVYHDLEEQMKGILGTKVCINHKDAKKGKLEIEYYSQDELDRIIDMIRTIQK